MSNEPTSEPPSSISAQVDPVGLTLHPQSVHLLSPDYHAGGTHRYNLETNQVVPWHRSSSSPGSSEKAMTSFTQHQRELMEQLRHEKEVTTREDLADQRRTAVLVRKKEELAMEHLGGKDTQMLRGRKVVAEQIDDLKQQLAAQIHLREESLARVTSERDSYKDQLDECTRKLRGVLTTMNQGENRHQRDTDQLLAQLAASREEVRALTSRGIMLDDQRSQLRHRVELAEGNQGISDAEIGAAQGKIERWKMEASRTAGAVSQLDRENSLLTRELHEVKAELHRALRSLDAAELRSSKVILEPKELLEKRVQELEDEVLRVQRNNARCLQLMQGLAKRESSAATHDALQFLKFVNGSFTFVTPSHRAGGSPHETASTKSLETILHEFNQTQSLAVRSSKRLGEDLKALSLRITEQTGYSTPISGNDRPNWVTEKNCWIPSAAYNAMMQFKRQFRPETTQGDTFDVLLQQLWSILKETSLPHKEGAMCGPELRQRRKCTDHRMELQQAAQIVNRDVVDVIKDGASAGAGCAVAILKQLLRELDSSRSESTKLSRSPANVKDQLRTVLRSVQRMMAHVECIDRENKKASPNLGRMEWEERMSAVESRMGSFLLSVEQWVVRGQPTLRAPLGGRKDEVLGDDLTWAQLCSEMEQSREAVLGLRRECYGLRDDVVTLVRRRRV